MVFMFKKKNNHWNFNLDAYLIFKHTIFVVW